jgi:hypothetical protein
MYQRNPRCAGGVNEIVKLFGDIVFFHGRAKEVPRAPGGIEEIVLRRGDGRTDSDFILYLVYCFDVNGSRWERCRKHTHFDPSVTQVTRPHF